MNRCQLEIALDHMRDIYPFTEVAEDIAAIQDGLFLRLGCWLTREEAREIWQHFAEGYYGKGWTRVDTGSLDQCAFALQAAYDRVMKEEAD